MCHTMHVPSASSVLYLFRGALANSVHGTIIIVNRVALVELVQVPTKVVKLYMVAIGPSAASSPPWADPPLGLGHKPASVPQCGAG